ncbi:MAG TPA: hypothetical protein VHC91_18020 [Trinickia sp.]|nr:hypothetical protein [Trinickia sp.]
MASSRLIFALVFATLSFVVQAKECPDSIACEFYLNGHGDLMRAEKKSSAPMALFTGSGEQAQTFSEYVMSRAGKYYLVRESYGNDKSFIIVPLDVGGSEVGFRRILYFSVAMQKSAASGREEWEGDEIASTKAEPIATFSWDSIFRRQDKLVNTTDSTENVAIQSGFSAATITIHDSNGRPVGRRTYIYAEKLGATPESVTCFSGCESNDVRPIEELRGGIGKYPIRVTLDIKNGQVSGSYRYEGKTGVLGLIGTIQENKLRLNEHPSLDSSDVTGKFSAVVRDSAYIGTWTAMKKKTQLPFFAVKDSI